MNGSGEGPERHWSERWTHLARTVGLAPSAPVLVALSGGADSTYLLRVLAASSARPPVSAVHVDHGLRGAESDGDADFCARLCRELGVPLVVHRLRLDPEGPSLEARAREARYRALAREAGRQKCPTVLTGHHADDNLETLLMRWVRGTALTGLASLRRRLDLRIDGIDLRVLRPLIGLRREEVRTLLAAAGFEWREDGSNRSLDPTRNRVRNVLLPGIAEVAGEAGVENLRSFGRAVEELEAHLARSTADLAWRPQSISTACRADGQARLGGTLPRAQLMRLPYALRRRALWRLILEGTGRAPRRSLLEQVLADLGRGRCTRHALPADYGLQLRSATLELQPPRVALDRELEERGQPLLPFPGPTPRSPNFLAHGATTPVRLEPDRAVRLEDGRSIRAELTEGDGARDVPREPTVVELDAELCSAGLAVRWAEPGDRFHPLGAPGSRPLRRVLADWGVPRGERSRVPLVVAGGRIVWVAGMRPSEPGRVRPPAARRVRLSLHGAAATRIEASTDEAGPAPGRVRRLTVRQASFWEAHDPAHDPARDRPPGRASGPPASPGL